MKKKILFLAAMMLAMMQATAANVDLMSAQQSAQRFLMSQTAKGRFMTSAPAIKWTHEEKNSSNASLAAYYIVNTDRGFVIIAGDDRARDILAYGDGTLENLNDLPDAMQFFLNLYKAEIEYLQAHPGLVVKKSLRTGGVSVEPMLTTSWSQGTPYNRSCPKVGRDYCKVGCPAISLGQVMKYWEYPEKSPALPGYKSPESGIMVDALPEYTFDWDNMLDSYPSNTDQIPDVQLNAVTKFLRYVGQAEGMDYNTDRSGASNESILDALRTFGYDEEAHYIKKDNFGEDESCDGSQIYTDEQWEEMIQSELRAGRPLVYCAFDMSSDSTAIAGHAFNVDGYDAGNGMYHVNFGMSAELNAYYAFNVFKVDGMTVYDFWPSMYVGVQPPGYTVEPRISISATELTMESYVDETATATVVVSGSNLNEGITVTLDDASGMFSADVAAISIDEASVSGKTVTVTYAPTAVGTHNATITLSSDGANDKVITIKGTATVAPLEVYDPVMLPADADHITATSFRADWTDKTPAKNVSSYTLEVTEKPDYNILAEADWSGVGQNYNSVADQYTNYFPEGWGFTGTGLWLEGGYISINGSSAFSTPTFTGCDKVTVVINANNNGYSSSKFTVSTSLASQDITPVSATTQYVVVLDCADSDNVTFTGKSGYPGFLSIQVYAGEVSAPQMRATENGNASYRLITGITDHYYTVSNLAANGTFLYKVKALYTDGTESAWSNIEEVTLVGSYSLADVTDLIDYLLNNSSEVPVDKYDIDGDNAVTIADVTALIDLLLNK